MGLAPDINEMLARARADLRMGVPIVLSGTVSIVAVAAESLSDARLSDVLKLDGTPVLALTGRRAQTLKAHVYDGNIARILVPPDAT
ncbi:MAG TPA: GTP cyclohydrolase II, partial [Rhodobacteraceae bacterium]|nr:GTP cyclohydrolase II [Paracoccaceae bacterium]